MPKGSLVNANAGLSAEAYYTRNAKPAPGRAIQGPQAVPAGSHAMTPENKPAIGCQMPKNDGGSCKMHPVGGTLFCVSHSARVARETSVS